jgi:hypothetical protein
MVKSVNYTQANVNQINSIQNWNGKIFAMGLGSLTNSRKAGMVALFLCQFLPPGLGYGLADVIARRLASNSQLAMVEGFA